MLLLLLLFAVVVVVIVPFVLFLLAAARTLYNAQVIRKRSQGGRRTCQQRKDNEGAADWYREDLTRGWTRQAYKETRNLSEHKAEILGDKGKVTAAGSDGTSETRQICTKPG